MRKYGEGLEVFEVKMQYKKGMTSIILLTHNQLEYTRLCIESIRKYTEEPYEIIVVDNASSDSTLEYIEAQEDISLIKNSMNLGFAGGCNQGVKAATGEYTVLLNNDTIVTSSWLKNLLSCLNTAENAAVVGPVTNNIYGTQKIDTAYESIEEMHTFANGFNRRGLIYEKTIRLVGFCLVMRRELFDTVGYLDEGYSIGNYEDDDFCLRTILFGYDIYINSSTFIHHFGSVTINNLEIDYSDIMSKNREYFIKKWGFDYSYHNFINPLILGNIDKRCGKLLHVGCGIGAIGLELKKRQKVEVIGVDYNKNTLHLAGRFLDGVLYLNSKRQFDIEFEADNFDVALIEYIVEYLDNPIEFFKKTIRYIKKGGRLILRIPNPSFFMNVKWLITCEENTDTGILDKYSYKFYAKKQIIDNLNCAGFKVLDEFRIYKKIPEEYMVYINLLSELSGNKDGQGNCIEDLKTYQYIILAEKL